MRSFLGAPIASAVQVYGRLYLTEKLGADEFNEEDERLALTLATQVAVAYENIRQYDEIQRHAARLQLEITERQRAEEALRTSEHQMAALVTSLDDIVFEFDATGTYLNVWARDERLLARPKTELLGHTLEEVLGAEAARPVVLACQRAIAAGDSEDVEYALNVMDGKRWFRARVSPILSPAGSRQAASMLIRDITERKQAEEDLRRNEQILRLFVEHSPAAIAMFDRHMNYIVASRRYKQDYELGDQDVVGRSHYDIFPEIPDRWRLIHQRCLAGAIETAEEDPFPRADGSLDWVRWEIHPWLETDGKIGGIILFSEVITGRKRAEETVAQLAAIVESSDDVIIGHSLDGTITSWNAAAQRLYGYSADEVKGQPVALVIPEALRVEAAQRIERLKAGEHIGHLETVRVRKDGQTIHVSIAMSPIKNKAGQVIGVSAIERDISERKRAEETLQQLTLQEKSRRRSRVVIELGLMVAILPVAVLLERYANVFEQAISHLLNVITPLFQLDEIFLGVFILLLASAIFSYRRWREAQADLHQRGQAQAALKVLHGELETRVQERTADLLKANDALRLEVIERQKAETALRQKDEEMRAMTQQLWHTAKLATMGELVAGIAHELNNPLATISLRIEALQADAAASAPQHHALDVIAQEVERMSKLVSNLLQSSRRTETQKTSSDLREEIDKTLELIHYHLRKRQIEVVRDFAPDVPLVLADRQQLRQVFLNLFTNASDAMAPGGRLTLRVAVQKPDPSLTPRGPARIVVEVSDTGSGIPPELAHKVWEPFFTTKSPGQGTGLGLPICRRIIEEHGGSIEALPTLPHGTTMRIALPIADER